MPKKIEALTPVELNRKIEKLKMQKTAGFIAVGGVPGLHLQVTAAGATTWILRFTAGVKPGTGKAWRRDLGLGSYDKVPLKDARDTARQAHAQIAQGIDPITEKREQRSAMIAARLAEITFEEAAEQFIAAHSVTWKAGGKSEHQWSTSLEDYAYPVFGSLRIDDIGLAHILKVLEPIWSTKTETARRIRSRLEQVLDWATVRGYRQGDNPARWRGALDKVLPAPDKVRKVKHHAALPIGQLPAFLTRLRQRNGVGAKALEFAILTAARSGEARGAAWDEIDHDANIWTIPAERMKGGKEHRVPLSADAVKLLKALPHMEGTDLVFAPPRGTNPLSDNTLTKVLKDMGVPVTAHGFRSTFRDWCAEHTEFPREVAEMALAHSIGSAVEAAYRRGDLFDKRRELMSQWASYCGGVSKT